LPEPAEAASKIMLDSSLIMGLDVLCNGGRAFVNCTRDMLLKDYVTPSPSSQTEVKILESVDPDDLVMAACQRLKEGGYMIALDHFAAEDKREPLTDIAGIIKVDVRSTSLEERADMVKRYGPWRCRMLAEKGGFAYFQGYSFRRPETLKTNAVPGNQLNYIKMLQVVSKPELEPREIENALRARPRCVIACCAT
jgi:c-di-GMP-related signal transduction protein